MEQNIALNPRLQHVQVEASFVGSTNEGDQRVTLDSIVAQRLVLTPDFVKIDVDGAELSVLSGMDHTLRTAPPVMLIEVHGADLEQDCMSFLSSRGYQVRLVKNAWWRVLYPEHRPIALNRWLLALPDHRREPHIAPRHG